MTGAFSRRLALEGLRLLPRNALSRVAGRVASVRLPRSCRAPAYRAFGRAVGVDFGEVRDPLESFASLQDFFTRAPAKARVPSIPRAMHWWHRATGRGAQRASSVRAWCSR